MQNNDSAKAKTRFDIAIIGGGVAGLSAAAFLADRADVVVLERESQPAYHSSGRSAAMYIEGYENPVVADLTKASGSFFFDPPSGFSDAPLLHNIGGLSVAKPGEEDLLQRHIDHWQSKCPELVSVDRDYALDLSPILRPDQVVGGAWDPSWQTIDVHGLILGYQRLLRDNGGTLIPSAEMISVRHTADEWQINTAQGQFTANVLVNAAGAWANEVATLANVAEKPLTPMRRTAVLISAYDEVMQAPCVHTISGQLYYKPESPGLMLSPADETPSPPTDAQPDELDIAVTIDRFLKLTTLSVDRPLHTWAGLRTFAPDRYPVIGFDENQPSFFWLAGQGGFGVQTSPEMGRLAAAHITRGEMLPDAIRADRF